MKKFLSSKVKEIKPSGIRKFFDIANSIEGVISLGVGEPDFDTPWAIREEGIYSLEQGKTYYTSNSGLLELRQAICSYMMRKYNLKYNPKNEVLVTVGGSEAIDLALRAMIEPGDEIIIPSPCYVSYEPCAVMAGGKVVSIPLKEENDFQLTKKELEEYITPKTKLLLLNYPNNPTGAMLDEEHLKEISEVCIKNDIFVISDEIYSELTYEFEHKSIASINGMIDRCLVINGFSKSYSMTGWRLGYACGPDWLIKEMTKIHQFTIMCAPTVSQYAAVSALNQCDLEVEKMRDEYNQRRRFLLYKFKEMGLKCFLPKGAFYVFPCIKEFGLSSEEFALRLLNEEKVVVVPGTAFGEAGEGFIRISYAYSLADLKKALDKLASFINRLKLEN